MFRKQKDERKTTLTLLHLFVSNVRLLCRVDGAHRAGVSASAAVDAGVWIDGVNVTLVDSALRALACASSASYAISF